MQCQSLSWNYKKIKSSHKWRYHCHQKIITLWHKCEGYKKLAFIEDFVTYLDQSYNFVLEMTSLFIITMSQFCDTNEKYISQLHTKYVCTVKGSYFVIAMSRFCDTNEPDIAMNLCETFFIVSSQRL